MRTQGPFLSGCRVTFLPAVESSFCCIPNLINQEFAPTFIYTILSYKCCVEEPASPAPSCSVHVVGYNAVIYKGKSTVTFLALGPKLQRLLRNMQSLVLLYTNIQGMKEGRGCVEGNQLCLLQLLLHPLFLQESLSSSLVKGFMVNHEQSCLSMLAFINVNNQGYRGISYDWATKALGGRKQGGEWVIIVPVESK